MLLANLTAVAIISNMIGAPDDAWSVLQMHQGALRVYRTEVLT